MTTNDAAERLHAYLHDEGLVPVSDEERWHEAVAEGAEAIVRRATVARIRAAVYKTDPTFQVTAGELSAILDEEAAR